MTTSATSVTWSATPDLPDLISFRYNPGPLREGNAIIGRPEEAKFGCTREQLFQGYATARERGVRRFGLHTMLASNELDPAYFIATARMLFELVVELHATLGIRFEFVNLGGGIGIPYRPEQQPVDLTVVSEGIHAAYKELIMANDLHPLRLCMECGRLVDWPAWRIGDTGAAPQAQLPALRRCGRQHGRPDAARHVRRIPSHQRAWQGAGAAYNAV